MRKPDLESDVAQAWELKIPEIKENGDRHSTIRQWMIRGREFHPFWDTWVITMGHLRDVEGLDDAVKDSPEFTHEFMIFALDPKDPKKYFEYDPDNLPFPIPFLRPIDVCVQFQCENDAEASSICDVAVKVMVAGKASPDSDFRSFWKQLIPATAKCGKHPEKKPQ